MKIKYLNKKKHFKQFKLFFDENLGNTRNNNCLKFNLNN